MARRKVEVRRSDGNLPQKSESRRAIEEQKEDTGHQSNGARTRMLLAMPTFKGNQTVRTTVSSRRTTQTTAKLTGQAEGRQFSVVWAGNEAAWNREQRGNREWHRV